MLVQLSGRTVAFEVEVAVAADGAALCNGAFDVLLDTFGIKDGVIDGTLPSFTLSNQHGGIESPSGDSIISRRIISIARATLTYAMSDK